MDILAGLTPNERRKLEIEKPPTDVDYVKWDIWRGDDMVDMVNHPPHYTQGKVECIDAIEASMGTRAFRGYLKGNVLKYLWRYEDKNDPVEDLKKARFYLNKLIENLDQSDISVGDLTSLLPPVEASHAK